MTLGALAFGVLVTGAFGAVAGRGAYFTRRQRSSDSESSAFVADGF
jgi:hypothetical protein